MARNVGRLDPVADDMRQRCLDDLAPVLRLLGRLVRLACCPRGRPPRSPNAAHPGLKSMRNTRIGELGHFASPSPVAAARKTHGPKFPCYSTDGL